MALELNHELVLKELTCTIKGKEIEKDEIISLEIDWNLNEFYTLGSLTFEDILNITETLPLKIYDEIIFHMKDHQEDEFEQNWIIIDIVEIKGDYSRPKMVSVKFIDKNSYEFFRVYECKGYKEETIEDVLKEYIDKYKVDEKELDWRLIEPPMWSNDSMNIIVPGDRSFLNTIYRWRSECDFLLFQTRKDIVATTYKELNSQMEREGVIYKQKPINRNYTYRIGEINVTTPRGLDAAITVPNTQLMTYDYKAGKKFIIKDINTSTTLEESGQLGETVIDFFQSKEKPIIVFNSWDSKSVESRYKKYHNKSFTVEILTYGSLDINIGDIVYLEIESGHENNINEHIGGKYLIEKLSDKIVQFQYMQKITLIRSTAK